MLLGILAVYFKHILSPLNYFTAYYILGFDLNQKIHKSLDTWKRRKNQNECKESLKIFFNFKIRGVLIIYFLNFALQVIAFYFSTLELFLVVNLTNFFFYFIKIVLLLLTIRSIEENITKILYLHGVGRFWGTIRQWNTCLPLAFWSLVSMLEVYIIKLPTLVILVSLSGYWLAFDRTFLLEEFLPFFNSVPLIAAIFYIAFLITLFLSLVEYLFAYKNIYRKGIIENIEINVTSPYIPFTKPSPSITQDSKRKKRKNKSASYV